MADPNRIALETMLELNARADVPHHLRVALDELDEQARKFLRLLDGMERDRATGFGRGSSIMLSIHGGPEAIADLVKQAERFRAMGLGELPEPVKLRRRAA